MDEKANRAEKEGGGLRGEMCGAVRAREGRGGGNTTDWVYRVASHA